MGQWQGAFFEVWNEADRVELLDRLNIDRVKHYTTSWLSGHFNQDDLDDIYEVWGSNMDSAQAFGDAVAVCYAEVRPNYEGGYLVATYHA